MTSQIQDKLRIALIQMRSSREMADNLKDAEQLIRAAASGGAQYVLTPENTLLMELDPLLNKRQARPMDENAPLQALRALARELKIWLHIGALAVTPEEQNKGDDRALNRSVLISPKGTIAAWYDKIHLFDVDLPHGDTYRESDYFRAGDKAVLADMTMASGLNVRLGLSICYDLRFPMLYRALAKAGAQILTVPAAFTEQTGRVHWHVLLRARAIETGCFVLAATQGGRHDNGRTTYGHSLIISPWGKIIAEAGIDPQLLVADLDLDEVTNARRLIPALAHDRPFKIDALSEEAAS